MTPALELVSVTKRFPGVLALDDVSFDVRPGEIHAFMGENGAGKSTLMKVAAGIHAPDAGQITVGGRDVRLQAPSDATALGIETVFQELTVLPNLSVGHNILVGREPVRLSGLMLDNAALYREAQAVLDRLKIEIDARTPLAELSTGERQMVEIARACAEKPVVLILDEPTSSLGRHEEEVLFDLVERLRDEGVAIVYITHRMSEVFRLSNRITVLRDGRKVVTDETNAFNRDRLIQAMVGRKVEDKRHATVVDDLPVALEARGLTRAPAVAGVDLALHAGEVLGVAGLMGAGRTEMARLIAGVGRPDDGTMSLFGQPYRPRTVTEAINRGVVYVPEDRKQLGLILSLSVSDNVALPSLRRFVRRGWLSVSRLRSSVETWMDRLGVRAASPDVRAETLSGGNQQKVVLAKWLAVAPKVILLDEPTRGVDVGAKAEIYERIRGLADDGVAIMVISSELPEVLAISDRIAVMAGGAIVGFVAAKDATEEGLLEMAFTESDAEIAA
ncbi:sugar ABC transporter ATP-binding protein [Bauldia sp.]|uniref:sugar ABC transporter ATP-binding protein n=1 Tax=Bauldia sp. TaxID=2575872 RepID=UPI003BAC92C9